MKIWFGSQKVKFGPFWPCALHLVVGYWFEVGSVSEPSRCVFTTFCVQKAGKAFYLFRASHIAVKECTLEEVERVSETQGYFEIPRMQQQVEVHLSPSEIPWPLPAPEWYCNLRFTVFRLLVWKHSHNVNSAMSYCWPPHYKLISYHFCDSHFVLNQILIIAAHLMTPDMHCIVLTLSMGCMFYVLLLLFSLLFITSILSLPRMPTWAGKQMSVTLFSLVCSISHHRRHTTQFNWKLKFVCISHPWGNGALMQILFYES